MRRMMFSLCVLGMAAAPIAVGAQTEISARGAALTVGGRAHLQYFSSELSSEDASSDFFVRRARISVDMTFTDFVTGKVLTDFAGGGATLLEAYVRLNFSDEFRITFGQLKRAFDIFELSSSTDLSLIERTGAVPGYNACRGVGGLCSYSRLNESLLFSGRDAGIRFDGDFGRLSYAATVTNGTPLTTSDVNDGKSVAGRLSFMATDNVQLSANATLHDYLDPDDATAFAFAWGGDVQVGTWRDGFLLQASLVRGENWASLDPVSYAAGKFITSQVTASYYFPTSSDRIVGVEPLGRISLADPDHTFENDGGTLVTPGVMLYFLGKNKFGINYDYYIPGMGDAVSSFRLSTMLYF